MKFQVVAKIEKKIKTLSKIIYTGYINVDIYK